MAHTRRTGRARENKQGAAQGSGGGAHPNRVTRVATGVGNMRTQFAHRLILYTHVRVSRSRAQSRGVVRACNGTMNREGARKTRKTTLRDALLRVTRRLRVHERL